MLALRRARAKQFVWRRLSSTTRKLEQKRALLLKPLVLIAGVSTAITAYLALCDQPYSSPSRSGKPSLNPSHFTPATLIESTQTSSDTKLLTLSLSPDSIPQDRQESASIWSVFVKDDDIQVERPYTPLEGIDESGKMSFWIKKYEHGEVARWLHSKQVGSAIELRGPVKTWTWKDGAWDDIIMVSGGTGITPFYQLLHHIFSKNACKGRLTLLHASKTPADLPPAHMMEFLHSIAEKHPDKFRFRVFVDSLDVPQQLKTKIPLDLTCDRIGKSALQDALRLKKVTPWWEALFWPTSVPAVAEDRRLIVLICGPEHMVNAVAGPYGRNYSQGKVGGILAELGLKSHQVWKL
ncbi:hypothetical protein EDD15DRAFT_2156765 [Pisolithus albus]|nr:hypothetical protein EDD15DRAFT_2156765 [Pisolithus albus]